MGAVKQWMMEQAELEHQEMIEKGLCLYCGQEMAEWEKEELDEECWDCILERND